jgi:hypothetical protein
MFRLSIILLILFITACRPYREPKWTRLMEISSYSNVDLKKLNNFNELPWRIRKSSLFKHWHLTSDSNKYIASKHNVSLLLGLAFDKKKKLGYILTRHKTDKITFTNSCILFQVIGDSINSNVFSIPDSVNTWKEAQPNLEFGNIRLFGGGIATKRQSRKMQREFRRKNKNKTP